MSEVEESFILVHEKFKLCPTKPAQLGEVGDLGTEAASCAMVDRWSFL
jgi:hypothetical protein